MLQWLPAVCAALRRTCMRTPKKTPVDSSDEATAADATTQLSGGKARARSAQFALQRGIGQAAVTTMPAAKTAPVKSTAARAGKKR